MEISQTAKGLFETGFDDDISQENMARILALFPTTELISDGLLELRDERGFVDMKRGELYPEIIGGVTRLRRTIASVYGIDFVQAQPNFACNGCIDTFLTHVQRMELTDGKRAGFMVATPTYFRYNHKVEALRMKLVDVKFPSTYAYPVDEVISALHERRPSCLFLVTPNNPTGLPIPDDQLRQILDNTPEDVCVAIDRTCANVDPEISTKELVHRYPHKRLAIFHSFSKYYSMSHLRIGFSVFSNKELASEVNRYLPFGLNLEALLKATHILATGGEFKATPQVLENINDNRRLATEFLRRRPEYKLTDFRSNYALLTLPDNIDSKEFNARLQPLGIFVMPGHDFPQPNDRVVRLHTGGPKRYLQRVFEMIESW
jgi:histidinol-phosphate/aromatic aminotransferase/cobyric acid decarboxylase-like protein